MSIHVALRHVTQYRYDRPVELSPQLVRLRPAPHCRTPILSYSQRITPAGHFLNWQQDPQSNYVARLTFPEKVDEFRVEVDLVAEMAVYNPFDFFLEPSAEHFPFSYETWQLRELQPFLHADPLTPRLARYLESIDRRRRRTIDLLVDVNRHLQQDISYVIRLDPGVQDVERTLELASGSCRDTTWLLVQLFRHLGLAARFVSGYLIQLIPDVKALDGPAGADRDFTDLHAWCEVYLPGAGWIGLDPTSGLLAGEGHIPLACTPEPSERRAHLGRRRTVRRSSSSTRCRCSGSSNRRASPSPTPTRSGRTILACGRAVDADLAAGDVRLTMGGEPTFVSVTDRDADEWNTAALGPTKRARAADLLCSAEAALRREWLRALGPGQVVSRRAAAALGARLLLARGRRSRRGRTRASSPTSSIRTDTAPPTPSASSPRSPRSWASPPATCRRATKTSGITSGASASCR